MELELTYFEGCSFELQARNFSLADSSDLMTSFQDKNEVDGRGDDRRATRFCSCEMVLLSHVMNSIGIFKRVTVVVKVRTFGK